MPLWGRHMLTAAATPHHGSSYMSMWNLSESIQELLHLQHPLPFPIMKMLRLRHTSLEKLHEQFTDICSELRIWSFYEAVDSQLSGFDYGGEDEVRFSAPIVSIKSTWIGVRQEQVWSLDSRHSHCASFGPSNKRTMFTYLGDLARAIKKAVDLSSRHNHNPLELAQHVKVELITGFSEMDVDEIRLYYSKHHLDEFLEKGPERLLVERLTKASDRPGYHHLPATPRPPVPTMSGGGGDGSTGLGIGSSQPAGSSTQLVKEPVDMDAPTTASPDIVVTRPSARPASKSLPATHKRSSSLTVPAFTAPGFQRPSSKGSQVSTASEPTEESSPKDGKGLLDRSVFDDDGPDVGTSQSEYDVRRRADRHRRAVTIQDLMPGMAGFSHPDPLRRKFMWIHMHFNNPPWVKVKAHDATRLLETMLRCW
jgi:hypothetical protein